jgi:hypothetical protein
MSETATQRWARRIFRPDESPPVANKTPPDHELEAQLSAAKRRFVAVFVTASERLGMPLSEARCKALGEIHGTAAKETG